MVGEDGVGAGFKPAPTALQLKIIPGQSYQALAAAHLAVVASGTATVEAALAGTPTVIVYRVSPLTFAVARRLVRVEHVGMANLLAGERLFPGAHPGRFHPGASGPGGLESDRGPGAPEGHAPGPGPVIRRLGGPGASSRAAQVALELMASARQEIKISPCLDSRHQILY